MQYNDYITRLSRKVDARLSLIDANFNFDYGSEWEIALCELLTEILPGKFGVCRGFIVNRDSSLAGDDIIIFDKLLFPTLRSGLGSDFALKEQVPVEAVYAYVECKHTATLEENGSLYQGIDQIKKAKELIFSREPMAASAYPDRPRKRSHWPLPYPPLQNQPFGMFFSRRANSNVSTSSLQKFLNENCSSVRTAPDLMVVGPDIVVTPTAVLGPDGFKSALFCHELDNVTPLAEQIEGLASAIGIMVLMQALASIKLEPIEWGGTLNEAFSHRRFNI